MDNNEVVEYLTTMVKSYKSNEEIGMKVKELLSGNTVSEPVETVVNITGLFVDTNREVSEIYSNTLSWEKVSGIEDFKNKINEYIGNNKMVKTISFDYDVETRKGGITCLQYLIEMCIRTRVRLPKIYLHCDDRNLATDFENTLQRYTKITNVPFSFEYLRRF
jgi:hypothetical protein